MFNVWLAGLKQQPTVRLRRPDKQRKLRLVLFQKFKKAWFAEFEESIHFDGSALYGALNFNFDFKLRVRVVVAVAGRP